MKGILLAGGTGSRLHPLTKVTNKHLLPVGREPMIHHPLKKMLETGIRDILVVTGLEHMGDVVNLLGSGRAFDCRLTYRVQDEAGGIAQALGLAEGFVGTDPMLVLLGDNIFQSSLVDASAAFLGSGAEAQILVKEVSDPGRYGVAEVVEGRVSGIEEKPRQPRSNYAVTGIYYYTAAVFEIIRTLKPSGRGELEITDVNNAYIRRGTLRSEVLDGWWTDAGTFESLALANQLIAGVAG
ncbi:MAG: sugar phosphate nucleotidyltransferase [bacterium]|jgi:glucose-1-phosphate thymidylyltransferase|nr:sugar phosphate nucleotidyltransferase [bacterium]